MFNQTDMMPLCEAATRVYFSGVDNKDWDLVATTFAPDAVAVYNSGAREEFTVRGRVAIAAQIEEIASKFDTSCHSVCNWNAQIYENGVARMNTVTIAHILRGGIVSVRGLHYDDQLAFRDGKWLVQSRVHRPLWQYEAPAIVPTLLVS